MRTKVKKSNNALNAKINKNFIIRVLVNPKENPLKNTKLTSANKLSKYLFDEKYNKSNEELKIKMFNDVLNSGKDKVTLLIRNRLKIVFQSK